MKGEPEDVQLARATLERKTGPESDPTAQALARAVIKRWRSSEEQAQRLDAIVELIFAERYTDPCDPAIAAVLRNMIREIVVRAIDMRDLDVDRNDDCRAGSNRGA
jgi:hypothetical protein